MLSCAIFKEKKPFQRAPPGDCFTIFFSRKYNNVLFTITILTGPVQCYMFILIFTAFQLQNNLNSLLSLLTLVPILNISTLGATERNNKYSYSYLCSVFFFVFFFLFLFFQEYIRCNLMPVYVEAAIRLSSLFIDSLSSFQQQFGVTNDNLNKKNTLYSLKQLLGGKTKLISKILISASIVVV